MHEYFRESFFFIRIFLHFYTYAYTFQTCVSKCPEGRFTYKIGECKEKDLEQIKSKLLCDKFVNLNEIRTCSDIDRLMEDQRCAKKYVPTKSCMSFLRFFDDFKENASFLVSKICFPKHSDDIHDTLNETLLAKSFRLPILSGVKEVCMCCFLSAFSFLNMKKCDFVRDVISVCCFL